MEFNTHDAKPTVGISPQNTPALGYELSRLPVASSLDADKTLPTARLPAIAASPCIVVSVWLSDMRSKPLSLARVAKPLVVIFSSLTVIGPHVASVKLNGLWKLAELSPI